MSNQILLSYVSTEDNKEAVLNAFNNTSLTLEKGYSISLSKLDLVLSNKTIPEFILPVKTKTIDTDNNKIYANSIYNFKLSFCKTDGESSDVEINFKFDITGLNVPEDETGQLDNFNDCFKISFPYFFSLLNKKISDTVENEFGDILTDLSSNNFKQLSPCFEANNDNITYYCLYNAVASNSLRYYNNLTEYNDDLHVGSYTFGFDEYIKNLLFREWETYLESDGYYYLKSNQMVNYDAEILTLTIDNEEEKYFITPYKSPHFYEYSSYIKSILFVIDGLNVSSMFIPVNNKSYSLINNTSNINSSLNVISVLQLDTLTKGFYRLMYSNPDQKNNSCYCNTDTSFNSLTATIYYVDKYNNIQKLKLYKGDTITSVVSINQK